jgi:hypothetical protein
MLFLTQEQTISVYQENMVCGCEKWHTEEKYEKIIGSGIVPATVATESRATPNPVGLAGEGAVEIELRPGLGCGSTGTVNKTTLKAAVVTLTDGRLR